MDRVPRRRLHRVTFVAAGAYNVAWGAYAALDPQWFACVAGLARLSQPAVFVTLGMVLGLYGLLYLEVARAPEEGWPIAAVGLVGKLLGPAGMAALVLSGAWPARAVVLIVTNDLVWWLPFGLYLRDAWPWYRREVFGDG